MRRLTLLLLAAMFFLPSPSIRAQEDNEGGIDNPYITRMPKFYRYSGEDKDFDAYKFHNGQKLVTIEGKVYRSIYSLKSDAGIKPSILQIKRNYENALNGAGATILYNSKSQLYDDGRSGCPVVTARMFKGGKEVWLEVAVTGDNDFWITVVERESMKQDVQSTDMSASLTNEGRVALYINFDINSATLKDDANAIIEQIAKMMRDNPEWKISIEGHSDNTGVKPGNTELSLARAKSVQAVLIGMGIERARLSVKGWGPDRPIADNTTDEGRKANRRVELVMQ